MRPQFERFHITLLSVPGEVNRQVTTYAKKYNLDRKLVALDSLAYLQATYPDVDWFRLVKVEPVQVCAETQARLDKARRDDLQLKVRIAKQRLDKAQYEYDTLVQALEQQK
jgi:hypothetical protein